MVGVRQPRFALHDVAGSAAGLRLQLLIQCPELVGKQACLHLVQQAALLLLLGRCERCAHLNCNLLRRLGSSRVGLLQSEAPPCAVWPLCSCSCCSLGMSGISGERAGSWPQATWPLLSPLQLPLDPTEGTVCLTLAGGGAISCVKHLGHGVTVLLLVAGSGASIC